MYDFGHDIKPKIDMGSKYPWKPLNDGPGPGVYDIPSPQIKGGYIEPEQPRMFTMSHMKMSMSTAQASPLRMSSNSKANRANTSLRV